MTDKPETVADVLAEIRAFPEAAQTRALQTWADRIERAMAASAVPVAGCGWAECPHGADCVHAPPAVPVESLGRGAGDELTHFVDGLGWVVRCCRATEYVSKLRKDAEKIARAATTPEPRT